MPPILFRSYDIVSVSWNGRKLELVFDTGTVIQRHSDIGWEGAPSSVAMQEVFHPRGLSPGRAFNDVSESNITRFEKKSRCGLGILSPEAPPIS